MFRRVALLLLGLLLARTAGAAPSPDAPLVAGRVLLETDAVEPLRAYDVRTERVRDLPAGWSLWIVRDADGAALDTADTRRLLERLAADDAAPPASADYIYFTRAVPDDDDYEDQWALTAIGAEAAWDITTGLATQRIGVIDSGIRTDHRELRNKDVAGYDFISDPAAAMDDDGRDADYEDDFDRADCNGSRTNGRYHGTAVSGVILASSDNNEGIAGVNWAAQLVTARVAGACGAAVTSDVLDAAAWLAGENVSGVPALGADAVSLVNVSIGRPGACSAAEQDVFDLLAARGVIAVASAGPGSVEAPANCNGVIAVGAQGPDGAATVYTAKDVDVFAPGGVTGNASQAIRAPTGTDDNDYANYEGTSFAAAHVTGAISLLLAVEPTATRARVLAALRASATTCSGCGSAGALDLVGAITALTTLPPVATEGEPCDAEIACDNGLVCSDDGGSRNVCVRTCQLTTGDGCTEAEHCLPVPSLFGTGACLTAGTQPAGSPCIRPAECVVGTVCTEDAARSGRLCRPACHHGFTCAPDLVCTSINPYLSYCAEADEPEPTEPEPTEPEPTDPTPMTPESRGCRIAIGVFDCANGEGCIDDGNDDGVGFCAPWSGARGAGELCDSRFDCASGICDSGVCLFGCQDGGCVGGYACDADVMEGGLCRPNACAGGANACAAGWTCAATSAGGNVCAVAVGGCTAVHGRAPGAGVLVLLALLFIRRRA